MLFECLVHNINEHASGHAIQKSTKWKNVIYDFQIIEYLYHIEQTSVHLKLDRPT